MLLFQTRGKFIAIHVLFAAAHNRLEGAEPIFSNVVLNIENKCQLYFPPQCSNCARAQMNACPLFYTTSSCSGRITLFLDRRAPGGTQSKGGEWLLITHGTVEWADLHRALYETFPARLRRDRAVVASASDADGNSHPSETKPEPEAKMQAKAEPETEAGALTLRFEPFILAVECATIDAASRMLRVAANAGFRCASVFGYI
jgi:tRNA(Phe) wybutosine-synthesizing methylase Tyw3